MKLNYPTAGIFLNCRKVAEQKLDETEDIEVIAVTLEEAIDMIMDNRICCNSSAHGIFKAQRLLGNSEGNCTE